MLTDLPQGQCCCAACCMRRNKPLTTDDLAELDKLIAKFWQARAARTEPAPQEATPATPVSNVDSLASASPEQIHSCSYYCDRPEELCK